MALPSSLQLVHDAVQVWYADLTAANIDTVDGFGVLDKDERARASRLRVAEDRVEFIAAHVIARILIGQYLGQAPETISFGQIRNGKPFAIRANGDPDLRFNAARTSGRAVFAFSIGREVGIDIERMTDHTHLSDAYGRALTVREQAYLHALPTERERRDAFFALWVRKEAVLKASGDGLAIAPDELDVMTETARICVTGETWRCWRFEGLTLDPACAAAVAAEGSGWRVASVRSYTESLTGNSSVPASN